VLVVGIRWRQQPLDGNCALVSRTFRTSGVAHLKRSASRIHRVISAASAPNPLSS